MSRRFGSVSLGSGVAVGLFMAWQAVSSPHIHDGASRTVDFVTNTINADDVGCKVYLNRKNDQKVDRAEVIGRHGEVVFRTSDSAWDRSWLVDHFSAARADIIALNVGQDFQPVGHLVVELRTNGGICKLVPEDRKDEVSVYKITETVIAAAP